MFYISSSRKRKISWKCEHNFPLGNRTEQFLIHIHRRTNKCIWLIPFNHTFNLVIQHVSAVYCHFQGALLYLLSYLYAGVCAVDWYGLLSAWCMANCRGTWQYLTHHDRRTILYIHHNTTSMDIQLMNILALRSCYFCTFYMNFTLTK
jgi:hypothetical protein